MKTASSYVDKRYIYNPKPEMLDEFWNDCVDPKDKKLSNSSSRQTTSLNIRNNQQQKSFNNNDNMYQHNQYHPNQGRNSNSKYNKKSNIRTYNSDKLFNPKNKSNSNVSSQNNFYNNNKMNSSTEKYLMNIYNKHPSFIEEMKEQEIKKIKSKNALIRCLGLYAYGLELQKTNKMNKENSDMKKRKDDLSLCTFKPKINKKISYLDENKIEYGGENNRLYQNNPKKMIKNKNRSVDNIHNRDNNELEKCTFKPKLNDPNAVDKIFRNRRRQNKTISDDKENAEFILRYTKARDEYLIKKFKKMYRKDDSYDYSLLSLTKRLCNKQYKNYLNVNNTIYLFGESISPNNDIHSSIADFRGLSVCNTMPDQKKEKKDDYIIGLRKNLHSLDLNENDNDNDNDDE